MLGRLATAGLPFAVPVPLAARGGGTVVPLGDGAGRLATLSAMIAGGEPDPLSLRDVAACGAALRRLHAALAAASMDPADLLRLVDRLDLDQPGWVASMGLPRDVAAETAACVARVGRVYDVLLATLPTQVVHGDFDASNVLLADGRAAGVLDFEFATVAPRALDVASGLWSFALADLNRGDP